MYIHVHVHVQHTIIITVSTQTVTTHINKGDVGLVILYFVYESRVVCCSNVLTIWENEHLEL